MRTLPPPAALLLCALLALCFPACGRADEVFSINGNVPSLAATAASGPKRSECGIGALMPWADKLYYVRRRRGRGGGRGGGGREREREREREIAMGNTGSRVDMRGEERRGRVERGKVCVCVYVCVCVCV